MTLYFGASADVRRVFGFSCAVNPSPPRRRDPADEVLECGEEPRDEPRERSALIWLDAEPGSAVTCCLGELSAYGKSGRSLAMEASEGRRSILVPFALDGPDPVDGLLAPP